MGVLEKLKSLNEARLKRAEHRRAEKAKFESAYKEFILECEELAPFAPKNPEASLFRHAWRRAEVFSQMLKGSDDPSSREFRTQVMKYAERAAKDYDRVAPSNAYGKVRLTMSGKQGDAIWAKEIERRNPKRAAARGESACIYLGTCGRTGREYVGQTVGMPELRWAQHRKEQTGPFKQGAINPSYDIIEIPVQLHRLDEREAYHIGYRDTYENGLNATRGNDRRAYEKGCRDRQC